MSTPTAPSGPSPEQLLAFTESPARLTSHLGPGARFESSPFAACGEPVFGDNEVARDPQPARDALRRAVAAYDRARGARRSGGGELWTALVAGRWRLLDSFTTAGTRYIVAHENPPAGETLRALSLREQSALEFALEGRSGKWIAFEMGLSESVVTRNLHAALHKLGVVHAAALCGVRNAQFEPFADLNAGVNLAIARLMPAVSVCASLSNAERAIVDRLLGGSGIGAIARERGTSPRTVANQLASTYQKLGVSSRRELLALFTWASHDPGAPQELP